MAPLFLLASIVPMLAGIGSGTPAAGDQIVRDEKNGQFLWKYYPPGALKRGEQGRVAFTLTVEPSGEISGCDVTQSSGFKTLDAETCDIMGLYAHLSPIRNADGRAVRATTTGFIVWKPPPGANPAAAVSTASTMPKPDKLICRKDVTTGSLIATTRQCLTRAEWLQQEQQTKDTIDRMGLGKGYVDAHGG